MNINGAFPSEYLKEADLQGRAFTVTMGRVEMGKVGEDSKPILHFQDAEKGLALNKTNANTIAELYGTETDNWYGHKIDIYPSETDFQGKRVPCIRVRRPSAGQAPSPQQNAMTEPAPTNPNVAGNAADDLEDSVPF